VNEQSLTLMTIFDQPPGKALHFTFHVSRIGRAAWSPQGAAAAEIETGLRVTFHVSSFKFHVPHAH
jgi:hypothetical protein